jgi:hypothetical protein
MATKRRKTVATDDTAVANHETNGEVVPPDENDAKRVLDESRARRAGACQEAVNKALAAFNCELVTFQQIVNGQPSPVEVRIVPR